MGVGALRRIDDAAVPVEPCFLGCQPPHTLAWIDGLALNIPEHGGCAGVHDIIAARRAPLGWMASSLRSMLASTYSRCDFISFSVCRASAHITRGGGVTVGSALETCAMVS